MMGHTEGRSTWRDEGARLALVLLACTLLAAGCRAPPLTERDERSPYDRYDAVRNQRADPYTQDKFGNKIPNLRGRLLPRN